MTARRISQLIFLLIMIVPVLVLNYGGFNIDRHFKPAPVGMIPAAEAPQGGTATPQVQPAWFADRPMLRDTFADDRLTAQRTVAVTQIVEIEDLLLSGEPMPAAAYHMLYATARAPARLISYCTDVITTIGTACDVSDVRVSETDTGKLALHGNLTFIPAFETGLPQPNDMGLLLTLLVPLPHSGDLAPENSSDTRNEFLTRAQAACDVLRDRIGNCVLNNVAFDIEELWITDLEALPPGTNPQRLHAKATMAFFADPNSIDMANLKSLVEARIAG